MRLIIILLALCFSACSSLRTVNKVDTTTSEKTDVEAESNLKTETKTDSEISTITTEVADTAVNVPGSEMEGSRSVDDLSANPIVLEDKNQMVLVYMDPFTSKVKVKATQKAHSVNIKFDKRTEKKESINHLSKSNSEASIKSQQKKTHEEKTTAKEVRKSFAIPWWIWLLLLLVIAGLFAARRFLKFW